ncbi:MAG: hypothetical protein HXY38_02745 [Chloroflexi bacterium]|nr:hypothetical protein [Chloroflexota bacterium]
MNKKNLSSFEKLLLGFEDPKLPAAAQPLRKGALCPQCGTGRLDYNGMLQLECPACGFVNGETGGCT